MIKGKNIVVVGIQSWDIPIGSNCKNIATELAKSNNVIYVNVPLDRKNYLKWNFNNLNDLRRLSVLKGRSSGLVKLADTFWTFYPKTVLESVNWVKNVGVFNFFNKLNAKRLSLEIQRITKQLGFENYILFNDSSMFRGEYLKELLQPELYIYYIRDNLITQNYFKKHGIRTEKNTIKSADLVVSNSPYLRDYAKPFNPNSFYVGQGCDLSLFRLNDVAEPSDLAQIVGIKIGYIGFLTQMRLNIKLLIEIAKKKQDWQIILVGPEDDVFKASELHQLPNVHFLGNKNGDDLPAYIQYFDVCMNPQSVNDLTIGNYPRKIDEYLAMGKATVATQTPTMEIFKDHVYLGETADDYIQLIEKILTDDSEKEQQGRIAFAQSHTWENNVNEIGKAILQLK
ncbi:MAG: glycosyltransferase involved in cell wall biosynthesis [Polaribacter sp.]|jgi:glycosyltransferase involved in cell wall biosynthesis